MKNMNSRFLTRTTLAVLACSGLAFGCVNNGDRDDAARDQGSSTTAPDTYSGTTTGADDTTSGATTAAPAPGAATTTTTTTAPAAGTTGTTGTTGNMGSGGTTGATGASGSTAGSADTHAGHVDSATTPDSGSKMASAKKNAKKKMKKSDKPAADAPKTDSSSINSGSGDLGMYENEDLNDEAGTEVTDPSLASTTNPDEEATNDIAMDEESTDEAAIDDDSTVSGATTSPDSTTSGASTGTESVSTSSASDEDLKSAARMAGGLSPWYTEPYSRIPTQVFRPTGIDKSVAALESYNEFIDPAALQRATRSRDALRPVTEIDFNSFGYDDRTKFTSQMNSRLANIDSRLDIIEAKAPEAKSQISTIHSDHMALETQLDDVRKVDEGQWNSFRDSFRDRLTALEREVARLSVSR